MQKKRLLQDLVDGLAADGNLKKKDVEDFIRHFFKVVEEGLLTDKIVRINGLGTFKLIEVDARSSVDVNTGESFLIKEHLKLSFIPDTDLKDAVNKPFEAYEPVPTPPTTPTVSELIKEPTIMKEPTNDQPSNEEQSTNPKGNPLKNVPAPPVDSSTNYQPEPDDPFAMDDREGGDHQQTIQEMLEELNKEAEQAPWTETGKKRRSLLTIILIALGLLFLAGLVYWSIDSNQKARQERALKEQLMEQLVLEVEPLSDQASAAALDSLAKLTEQETSNVDAAQSELVSKPATKPAPKPTATPKQAVTVPKTVSTVKTATAPTTKVTTTSTAKTAETATRPAQVTVKAGDRLTQLAEKYYGHKAFWVYIYLENKTKIEDPNSVPAGTTLVLPKPHPTLMDPKNAEAIKRAEGIQERILSRY